MKKNALSGLILLFTILLSLFACRKSIEFYVEGKEAPQSNQIESAKIWRSQHIDRSIPTENVLHAFWDDAWTVQTVGGKELIVVPAPEHKLRTKNFSLRRYFIFTVSGNIITEGNIFEFLGEKCDVEEKLKTLLPNIERTTIPEFTGLVAKYDINYHHINSISYKDGKRTSRNSRIESVQLGDKAQNFSARASTDDCIPIWPIKIGFPSNPCTGALYTYRADYVYDQDGCFLFLTYTYLFHTCPGGVTAPPSGGGSSTARGSGSGRSVSNPDYGNPPGGGTTAPDTIIEHFDDYPCAKSIVGQLTSLNNTIAKLMRSAFNNPTLRVDLEFSPDSSLIGTNIDGKLDESTVFIQRVGINPDVLKNASKEFILVTLYHEAIHAYLADRALKLSAQQYATQFGDWAISNDRLLGVQNDAHLSMGRATYVNGLRDAILAYNPSFGFARATALAEGGILILTTAQAQINNQERDTTVPGYQGTKCPTSIH